MLKVLVELFLSGSRDICSRLQSAHVCLSGEVPVVYINSVLVGFFSVSALCWVQENLWVCRLSNFFFFWCEGMSNIFFQFSGKLFQLTGKLTCTS